MQLTEHFSEAELGVFGCEQRLVDNARFLCERLLEPLRGKFGAPIKIHDGYRDPAHNARVDGKPASWHLFTGGRAAADFHLIGIGLYPAFDWIRLESGLPFDKVIIEFSAGSPACLHFQVDRQAIPRRQAFTGDTGAGKVYVQMEVR